jgi:PAS domain S-box-containing protein
MTGFEAARLIRAGERSRHTPIVFLTAYEDDLATIEQAYALGAVDYLVKPLVPVIVRAKVAALAELYVQKERARRQAEQMRLLIQGTTDYAIFMLDPHGRVATWNAGAERLKGYRSEEIVGRHFSVFYPREEVERGRPQERLGRAEADGRVEDEGWRVRKDGTTFWANVLVTALRDDAGRLVGFGKVTRDLTVRRQAEDQARQLAAERAALAEAEAAARRKDQFLAMLAHELRNPLATLAPALQALRQPGTSEGDRRESLDRLERQAGHLTRLVDDLLEASRVAHGKVSLRAERVDLGRVARTAAGDRRALIEAAGLSLDVQTPPTPVWVNGDATRLDQIVQNLLDNTARFCDAGHRVEVRVEADAATDQAVLTVRDDCLGIAPEVLPRLFRPFEQAGQGLERRRGGLGLGLSVVRGLAELHGGTAEASSDGPGRGATFTVRLPLVTELPALTGMPDSATAAPGQPSKVLIVEDNRDAAESLDLLLTLLGHRTRVARSGPEGVQAAEEFLPDVVLCDLGLPGFDGYEVARRVRTMPGLERALLVAVSGYAAEEDRRRGREAGFDHHLAKPADPSALQRMLEARSA